MIKCRRKFTFVRCGNVMIVISAYTVAARVPGDFFVPFAKTPACTRTSGYRTTRVRVYMYYTILFYPTGEYTGGHSERTRRSAVGLVVRPKIRGGFN